MPLRIGGGNAAAFCRMLLSTSRDTFDVIVRLRTAPLATCSARMAVGLPSAAAAAMAPGRGLRAEIRYRRFNSSPTPSARWRRFFDWDRERRAGWPEPAT